MLLLSPVHTNTMTDKCLPFAFIAHILHAETNGTGSLGASAAEGKMHTFLFYNLLWLDTGRASPCCHEIQYQVQAACGCLGRRRFTHTRRKAAHHI